MHTDPSAPAPVPEKPRGAASARPDILCIGSALWDFIGRAETAMVAGDDRPGRIRRIPGGVALNVAAALAAHGCRPALLGAVGRDAQGDALVAACETLGVMTDHLYRPAGLATDLYMAIEADNGLIAAIADAHSLEAAGGAILLPLRDGTFGTPAQPWSGTVALDGNLTAGLLCEIASDPAFAAADLRIAPASPGKAERLAPLIARAGATFYLNLEEAGILCGAPQPDARTAADALVARGAWRVLVTDGGRACAEAGARGRRDLAPPPVMVRRVTGAGDRFMAAHIAAEIGGATPDLALAAAVAAAAAFVSAQEG